MHVSPKKLQTDIRPNADETAKSDLFVDAIRNGDKKLIDHCVVNKFSLSNPNFQDIKPMEAKTKDGMLLLHYAAYRSHPHSEDTPLSECFDNGHSKESTLYTEVVSDLVKLGVDINSKDAYGCSVLSYASARDHPRAINSRRFYSYPSFEISWSPYSSSNSESSSA